MPRRWACDVCRRRHTWVPPYKAICKTCVGAAALPRPFPYSAARMRAGVEPRPHAGQDGFLKNVIPRSTATWESVFPVWQRCSVGVLRIATPACGLVRNDIFGKRGGGRRRHTWVPPYGGISRSAVERGNEDAVPYGGMVGDARQAGGVGRRPLRLRGGRDNVGIAPLTGT